MKRLAVCVLGIFLAGTAFPADIRAEEELGQIYLDDADRLKAFEDVACIVMEVSGGASLTRGHTRIRSSIKKGHVVFKGDSANLSYGAELSLSFSPTADDVMRFQGPCLINFVDSTQIELSHGKVFAALDSERPVRLFKIKTPGAITTARDAQFLVEVKHQGAEVKSFKSSVKVYGINPVGEERTPGVTLEEGQKTSVSSLGKLPESPPRSLNRDDRQEEKTIKNLKSNAQDWVREQTETWVEDQLERREPEGRVKFQGEDWKGDDRSKQKVLF